MEEWLKKKEKQKREKDSNKAENKSDELKEIGLLIKDGYDSAWYWENSWRNKL